MFSDWIYEFKAKIGVPSLKVKNGNLWNFLF